MSANRQHGGVDVEAFLDGTYKGIQDNMGDTETLPMAGRAMSKTDLLAAIAAKKKPYDDVRAARNAFNGTVRARNAAEPAAQDFAEAIEAGITSTWGTDPNVKANYGVPLPKTPRTLTVEQKMERLAKAAATRAQRGTKGKNQKSSIKAEGEVTVTTSLANTRASAAPAPDVPAATAPAPAPAATAPAAPVQGTATPANVTISGASNGVTNGAGH